MLSHFPIAYVVSKVVYAALKAILPTWAKTFLYGVINVSGKTRKKFQRRPPIGWVRFGTFKRLDPVDPEFGSRWGKIIDRYYIEEFLRGSAQDIRGHVLEVAENTYTRLFGG